MESQSFIMFSFMFCDWLKICMMEKHKTRDLTPEGKCSVWDPPKVTRLSR